MLQKNSTDKHTFSSSSFSYIMWRHQSFIYSFNAWIRFYWISQSNDIYHADLETYSLVTPVLSAVMFWCKVQVNPKTKCVTQTGKISTSVECVSEPLMPRPSFLLTHSNLLSTKTSAAGFKCVSVKTQMHSKQQGVKSTVSKPLQYNTNAPVK